MKRSLEKKLEEWAEAGSQRAYNPKYGSRGLTQKQLEKIAKTCMLCGLNLKDCQKEEEESAG